MKVKFFTVAASAAILLFSSCINDDGNHQLAIEYPTTSLLFADQTKDSIVFHTYDSYRIISEASWIKVPENSDNDDIKHSDTKRYRIATTLELEPNKTGRTRLGNVRVDSYEYTVYGLYVQMGCLNIMHPQGKVESSITGAVPDSVSFQIADSSYVNVDSLVFMVYHDWELSIADGHDASWLEIEKKSGSSGRQKVNLNLQTNTTSSDRDTKLVLKSGGAADTISVKQFAPKKEE